MEVTLSVDLAEKPRRYRQDESLHEQIVREHVDNRDASDLCRVHNVAAF